MRNSGIWFTRALVFLFIGALVLLAACVQIPEEPTQPEAPTEEAPPASQENVTSAPEPAPAQNATTPLAPLPTENKTTAAVLPTSTVINTATSSNSTSKASGWTTEPLQIEEGETLRVVLKKTV